MHNTLHQLKRIATAIGYQVLQSDSAPGDYFLVRQIGEDSVLVAQIDIQAPSNAKYSIDDLSEALGLAIEHLVAVMMANMARRCHDTGPIPGDRRLMQVADAAGLPRRIQRSHHLSRQDILELADSLHKFAVNLYQREN